jgi:integrase
MKIVRVMDETPLTTPLTTPAEDTVRKPRKRELKNLTRREGIWYFQKVVNGKKEFAGQRTPFSLETRDLVVAKAKRDAILRAANGSEVDRVLGRSSKKVATLGEIFSAYRAAPTVRASAGTRERNIGDLVRLVRLVKGDTFGVETASSEILTKALAKEWQSTRLAAAVTAAAGDLAALEASKRTINSTLTHVQSLFSREAKDDYGALHLPPNVAEFATALPIAARKQEKPRHLEDAFVATLLALSPALQSENPAAWAVWQLMLWGGLRNIECFHARETWLEACAGADAYRIEMKPDQDFLPKGNSRTVILPGSVARALLAQLPAVDATTGQRPDNHLVPAKHPSARHDACYRDLNGWLRTHGVGEDAGKIAYRLRKYWAKKLEEQQGIFMAQAGLGHSSLATTTAHYTGAREMSVPITLGATKAPPPAPPSPSPSSPIAEGAPPSAPGSLPG